MKNHKDDFWRRAVAITLLSLAAAFAIGGVFYQITPLVKGQEISLSLSKYQSAIATVQSLISALPKEIFTHSLLGQLKQPLAQPFIVGAVGNDNPFQLPEPPEILLQPKR